MRRFSSYGPIDRELHYYVPRQELIDKATEQLKGYNPNKGGHYLTIWAPHQTGKTWIMQEVVFRLRQENQFEVVILPLQHLSHVSDVNRVAQVLGRELIDKLNLEKFSINTLEDFGLLFKRQTLNKPLILILDEFDGLQEPVIAGLVGFFRNIYNSRQSQADKSTANKDYLLHGMALIGVRTVLGVENVKGSPFNVQRSLHIPNLTHEEVAELFNGYQIERGQSIEAEVAERIWSEFQGQPGLTSWFGELLTETYNQAIDQPITMTHFEGVYAAALDLLPNNNILNLISKAKQAAYKPFVLELFQTKTKVKFTYRNPITNFLYLNGVVEVEPVSLSENYVKFPCPYVQKQLFSYFAGELSHEMDDLYGPFEDLSDTVTEDSLNLHQLFLSFVQYFQSIRVVVLLIAAGRGDLRVYEAVFHFHIYLYLTRFLSSYKAQVQPEFPTGNGQIDLLIRHGGQLFGLELKSFADQRSYCDALVQAAKYGQQLKVTEIWLVLFIESVDESNRQRFEVDYTDDETGVIVHPQFVQTG